MKLFTVFLFVIGMSMTPYAAETEVQKTSDVVKPPASLTTRGPVPGVPADLYQLIKRATEPQKTFLSGWHPTEEKLLIDQRVGERYQAHTIEFNQKPVQHTCYLGDIESIGFSPLGDGFAFYADPVGSENWQFYWHNLIDQTTNRLTDGVSRCLGLTWTSDAERVAFIKVRDRTYPDIWIMNPLDTSTAHCVYQVDNSNYWWTHTWCPNDSLILVGEHLSGDERYMYYLTPETGELRRIVPTGDTLSAYWGGGQYDADGILYVITNHGAEYLYVGAVHPENNYLRQVSVKTPYDIGQLAVSASCQLLAYDVNRNGLSELHLVDLETSQDRVIASIPSGVIKKLIFHQKKPLLAVSLDQFSIPQSTYVIDCQTDSAVQWTGVGQVPGEPTKTYPFSWTTWDERQLSGYYVLPSWYDQAKNGKLPVLVMIHGGPASQARPSFQGWTYHLVNDLGIALVYPNIRGSKGYGAEFVALDNDTLRQGAIDDISTCLSWIEKQPQFNADKIMVFGGSYGGFLCLTALIQDGHRLRGGIDFYGITNMVTYLENTAEHRKDRRRREYGDERIPEVRAYLERIAPVNNVDKIKSPLLIVQGAKDMRVPKSEAVQMVKALEERKVICWYLEFGDAGHATYIRQNADYEQAVAIMFIQQYLINDE